MVDTEKQHIKLQTDSEEDNLICLPECEEDTDEKINIPKEDTNETNKNYLERLCLILFLSLALLSLFFFRSDSWMEQKTVTSYNIIHFAALRGKQPGCGIDNLAAKSFCRFKNLQPDLNLPGCKTGFSSDGFNRNTILDIVAEVNQNINSDWMGINFGAKVSAPNRNRISSLTWHSLDLRLTQMSVCLENATGYVTVLKAITTNRNVSILPSLGQMLINIVLTPNTQLYKLREISSDLLGKKSDEVWTPCQKTQSGVACVLSETTIGEVKFRNVNQTSKKPPSKPIDIDKNTTNALIGNVLTKISQNKNKCDREIVDFKICGQDIAHEFLKLFKVPLIKKKFSKTPILSERPKKDELITRMLYSSKTTSASSNIVFVEPTE